MRLLLSSLHLAALCALSSPRASSDVPVDQTPSVSVMEGEAASITCCWTSRSEKVVVSWLKNHTELESGRPGRHLQKEEGNCSTLSFLNVTREDSGRYLCKITVEIPTLEKWDGAGTVITVVTRNKTEDKQTGGSNESPLSIIISNAVVAPVLLVVLCCVCRLYRRQARVIREVPHTDSEEAEMDKHSTSSSRGSSQWCQVPLYESVDYFEHVEMKRSG